MPDEHVVWFDTRSVPPHSTLVHHTRRIRQPTPHQLWQHPVVGRRCYCCCWAIPARHVPLLLVPPRLIDSFENKRWKWLVVVLVLAVARMMMWMYHHVPLDHSTKDDELIMENLLVWLLFLFLLLWMTNRRTWQIVWMEDNDNDHQDDDEDADCSSW